jgi:N-acylneuraminate cytidylyltransferase
MNLAIIPARGGSKRIKNKNITDFCGRPIISYSLDCARDSGLFGKIQVSTDSPETAEIAKRCGHPVDFLRAAHLADDVTPLMPVIQWVTQQYVARGEAVETICLMMPCAPLIQPADLRKAHKLFLDHGATAPVVSVVSYAFPIQRAFHCGRDGLLHPLFPENWAKRSQDLPRTYHDAGGFYFLGVDHVLNGGQTIGDDIVPYELPRHRAIDIDEPDDLRLAEFIYRGMLQSADPE